MTEGFARSWTDPFGTACLSFEGGTGRRSVLVTAAFSLAAVAMQRLEGVPDFKGRIVLCGLEVPRVAPLEQLLRDQTPDALVALEDMSGIAASGPALRLAAGEYTAPTGLRYLEPSQVPAWHSSLRPHGAVSAPSLAASLASERRIPALACGLESLNAALELMLETAPARG